LESRVNSHGFTLIEMVVVIAIIGILSAVLLPNAFKQIEKSRVARTAEDMKSIKTGTLMYYSDTSKWPRNQYILNIRNSLMQNIEGVDDWDGPYLENYGKSPLVRDRIPGMAHPGWYYIWGRHHDSGWQYFRFNLDGSGSGGVGDCEILDGISVSLYGITEHEAMMLDRIFDGEGKRGYYGTMNVVGGGTRYWLISLFIGQTGFEGGMGDGY